MNFYAEALKYFKIVKSHVIGATIQNLFVFFKNHAKTCKEIILQG